MRRPSVLRGLVAGHVVVDCTGSLAQIPSMLLGKTLRGNRMPDVENIRALFLHPRPAYPLPDAAALLGIGEGEVRGWVEVGELAAVDGRGGLGIPWAELVSFGMDLWSQDVVEEALGADVAGVIPELVRLTDLEVRIPRMEVVALERVAARDGQSVDRVLARELLDFVSANSAWLDREVPGFLAALAWPEAGDVGVG
jgi:hypothetical protein